jgi:hypothetical protein
MVAVTSPLPAPLNPAGPAQSEFLIHFCGRPAGRQNTPSVPVNIRGLAAAQRLDNVLWEQRIVGFAPFGQGVTQPMVCFSESLCVPKTSSTSCDQAIFVNQATDTSLL